MSDSLATDTPADGTAATAPDAQAAAAAVGSVDSPEVIPAKSVETVDASRFNGLMARYQSDKSALEAELSATRTEVERLRAELENIEVAADDSDIAAAVQRLEAELVSERVARAREKAVAKHPEAAPFADMLVGNTVAEIEAAAAEIASRIKGLAPNAATDGGASTTDATTTDDTSTQAAEAAAAAAAAAAAPQLAGGQSVDDSASADEAITEAIGKGDFQSLWGQLQRRASERAVQGRTDLSV